MVKQMDSIALILQQKPVNLAVKDIIRSGKKCWKTVDLAFIQFLVEILDKDWDFNWEDYETLMAGKTDFVALANDIHQSERYKELSSELPVQEFIQRFIEDSKTANILVSSSINNWIALLMAIVNSKDIPMAAGLKGRTFMLLAFLLEPLVTIISGEVARDMDDKELDLYQRLEANVIDVLSSIHGGYRYEKYAMLCAKEFASTILKYHELIVKDGGIAVNFNEMLNVDNRSINALALKTLNELCQNDAIRESMKEAILIVDGRTGKRASTSDSEPLLWTIINLLSIKKLNYEVVSLLATLTQLIDEDDVLLGDYRYEVLNNIFSKNKKLVAETVKLMAGLKVNIWMEVIHMINVYAEDDTDVASLISPIASITAVKPEELLEIVNDTIMKPISSRRAAEIFSIIFSENENRGVLVGSIISTLEQSKKDECTFIILLKALMDIDIEILVDYFKAHRGTPTKLNLCVSNAFIDFDKPISLNVIVSSLEKIYRIQPILAVDRVRKIASGYYEQLKACGAANFAGREKLVPKLSALFERVSWSLLENEALIDLYNICQKYCKVKYTYFAYFQQLRVNLLKHIWMLITTRGEMIIDQDKLTTDIRSTVEQIGSSLKNSQHSIIETCLLLSSLLNLYVLFQPKMNSKCKHPFFTQFHVPLTKEDYINIVDSIEAAVLKTEIDKSHFYQQWLFRNFVSFYKNYIDLPSLTAWETFLRHYNAKSNYKSDIEALMNTAIEKKKTIFEKSVAFAILNFANAFGVDHFRAFYSAFDDYLRKKVPDFTQRGIVFGVICSIILERFSKQISVMPNEEDDNYRNGNRLVLFDFMEIMVKKSDFGLACKLNNFIRINENLLSPYEKLRLDNFKMFLLDH